MQSHSLKTLTLDQLAFERDQRVLFSEMNLVLQAGECLQVRGSNGSGKSTLLRLLAGLLELQTGQILWQGKSIVRERHDYHQAIHYLGHQNGIKPNLSVQENLYLSSTLTKKTTTADRLAIIQQVGLKYLANKLAAQLSAGQLRRLALARLLLSPSTLWILDEPTTALDTEGQQLLTTQLNLHLANGGLAVIATHQDLCAKANIKTIWLGEQHA